METLAGIALVALFIVIILIAFSAVTLTVHYLNNRRTRNKQSGG